MGAADRRRLLLLLMTTTTAFLVGCSSPVDLYARHSCRQAIEVQTVRDSDFQMDGWESTGVDTTLVPVDTPTSIHHNCCDPKFDTDIVIHIRSGEWSDRVNWANHDRLSEVLQLPTGACPF